MAKLILVIEDDADIRDGLCVQLRARGYATEAATDAFTGQSLALRVKPALILLDLGLPGGDGVALLKRLTTKGTTSLVPVIVLTGRDPRKYEDEVLRSGAAGFFQKPPDMDRLVAAIEEQLGGPEAAAPVARKKILIVEDDADTRAGLAVRLRKAAYETVFAGDAGTAIMVAQKERPDLVILDLGLPAGDGFLVLERLKKIGPLQMTPVVVVSARDPEANRPRALRAGAAAYFHKPADMAELLATIQDLLAG